MLLYDIQFVLFKLISSIKILSFSYEIALWWMSQDLTDDQSTLIQVMAWWRQATSYLLPAPMLTKFYDQWPLGHNDLTRSLNETIFMFGFNVIMTWEIWTNSYFYRFRSSNNDKRCMSCYVPLCYILCKLHSNQLCQINILITVHLHLIGKICEVSMST